MSVRHWEAGARSFATISRAKSLICDDKFSAPFGSESETGHGKTRYLMEDYTNACEFPAEQWELVLNSRLTANTPSFGRTLLVRLTRHNLTPELDRRFLPFLSG